MKKTIILLTLGIMGIAAIAQEVAPDIWNFKLGVAKQSKTKYDNSITLAKKEYDNKLVAAKAELVVDLRKAAKIALEINEVDEALKIQSAIKEVQKDIIPAPTSQPKAVVQNNTAIKGKWTIVWDNKVEYDIDFVSPNSATFVRDGNNQSHKIQTGVIKKHGNHMIVVFPTWTLKYHIFSDRLYAELFTSVENFNHNTHVNFGIGTRIK